MQQTLDQFFNPASKRSGVLRGVREFVEDNQLFTNWNTTEHDGWEFPATSSPHCWCGIWKTEGCLNEEIHHKLGYGRCVYVKQYQRSCYRARCTLCYVKWIARQANKATRRIEAYGRLSKKNPIHVLLSPPSSQYCLPIEKLRKKMNEIIEEIKLDGGAAIFHPFRLRKKTWSWYYAPHFHLVGFGYIRAIKQVFAKYGWFIKYMGVRKSTFQTFCYLLSHSGIKKRFHSVTWLGRLSYSKLRLEKEPDFTKCPICGRKFIEIYHDGIHPVVPPDKMFEGIVYSGDWYPVKTELMEEWTKKDRYEYAIERELYEANKGIPY